MLNEKYNQYIHKIYADEVNRLNGELTQLSIDINHIKNEGEKQRQISYHSALSLQLNNLVDEAFEYSKNQVEYREDLFDWLKLSIIHHQRAKALNEN